MKPISRFVMSAALITIGSAIWYATSSFHIVGLIAIGASGVFAGNSDPTEITQLRLPKWNARRFFPTLTLFLGAALIAIPLSRLPQAEVDSLFGSLLFTGLIWLLLLSRLMTRYLEDRETSLHNNEQQSDSAVAVE